MRRVHYLPHNKGNELPSACIWFDTETKSEVDDDGTEYPYLWFGWACYSRRNRHNQWSRADWFRFTTVPEFWDWVESHTRAKVRLHLFCHNAGFDLPVLDAFNELWQRGWSLYNAVVDGPPTILTYRRDKSTLRCLDTLNIWRCPLSQIGDAVGLEKLDMPPADAPAEEWDRYGKRDTEIIRAATLQWFQFLRDNDLGGFSPTLASQAFNAYRHRFKPCEILIDDHTDALELARESYTGGRVECFRIGRFQGPLYHLDVNSLYPSVMASETYPARLIGHYRRLPRDKVPELLANYSVVAEVTLDTPEPVYSKIQDGQLLFPVGRFRAVLTTPELVYAWVRGHVTGLGACALYEPEPLFAEYVETLYRLRQGYRAQGNETNAWMVKILMNSLYGKFGQRGRRYDKCADADNPEVRVWTEINADTGAVTHYRQFGGIVQEWIEEGESFHSHPAIAAHVTAHGRMVLWRLMQRAGRENVYYCDTDCVLVNRAGYDRLASKIDPDRLGALKLEGEYSEVELWGPKDYRFGEIQRTKGVRKSARWIAPDTVIQQQFTGIKGLLRSGQFSRPTIKQQRKHLVREYKKGEVSADGTVTPFRLA